MGIMRISINEVRVNVISFIVSEGERTSQWFETLK